MQGLLCCCAAAASLYLGCATAEVQLGLSDGLCKGDDCDARSAPPVRASGPAVRLKLAARLGADPVAEALAAPAGEREFRWPPRNRSEFLAAIVPHAQRAAEQIGVPVHALIAQAALETGWGRRLARGRDGKAGFNLFGIKAGADWDGHRMRAATREYVNGRLARRRAAFRAYRSLAEAFDDYVDFLRRNPRYAEALRHADDSHRFVRRLQLAGYSTDPHYAEKIRRIASGSALRRAVAAQARSASQPKQEDAEIAVFNLHATDRVRLRASSGLLLAPRD